METAKNAVNYVTESIQGTTSEASKEANKDVAKDSNADVTARASAAKDALGDKLDQASHDGKAESHKQAATH